MVRALAVRVRASHEFGPTSQTRDVGHPAFSPVFPLVACFQQVPAQQPKVALQHPFWGDVSLFSRREAALLGLAPFVAQLP